MSGCDDTQMLVNLIKHHQASPNYNRLFVTLPAWPPTESLVAYVSVTALRSRPTSDESDVTRVQLWSIAAVSLMELIIIILVHFQNVSHNRHNPDIAWALYIQYSSETVWRGALRRNHETPQGQNHRTDKQWGKLWEDWHHWIGGTYEILKHLQTPKKTCFFSGWGQHQ